MPAIYNAAGDQLSLATLSASSSAGIVVDTAADLPITSAPSIAIVMNPPTLFYTDGSTGWIDFPAQIIFAEALPATAPPNTVCILTTVNSINYTLDGTHWVTITSDNALLLSQVGQLQVSGEPATTFLDAASNLQVQGFETVNFPDGSIASFRMTTATNAPAGRVYNEPLDGEGVLALNLERDSLQSDFPILGQFGAMGHTQGFANSTFLYAMKASDDAYIVAKITDEAVDPSTIDSNSNVASINDVNAIITADVQPQIDLINQTLSGLDAALQAIVASQNATLTNPTGGA